IHNHGLPGSLNEQSGLSYHFTDPRDRQLKFFRHLTNPSDGFLRRAQHQLILLAAFEGNLNRIDFCPGAAEIPESLSDRQQFAVNHRTAFAVLGYVTEVSSQAVAYVDHGGGQAPNADHSSRKHSRGRDEMPPDRSLSRPAHLII